MRSFMLIIACTLCAPLGAQSVQRFSSINPVWFGYTAKDVNITSPQKYNNGQYIIAPNPAKYPWEAKLENGMPNVLKDSNGNLSVYLSCFLVHSPVPFSKVGAFVYTNSSNSLTQWERPDAGLYWYNPKGVTVDDKISPSYKPGYQASNIVAVDIESMGIYDDHDVGVQKPVKLVYLPQREMLNQLVAGYEMEREFLPNGVLSGFAKMKADRKSAQKQFVFDYINADTHMSLLKQNGDYFLLSRINAKRSSLLQGETLPFSSPDPRTRYRRETLTMLGNSLSSGHYGFDVGLDMSDNLWEPYSVQPFRLDGYESDIWIGLVTTFGTRAIESVANRQRTELAVSNNGLDWFYLKPGTPFLDNSTDPQSDDHGCINIAKPVPAGKYGNSDKDLLYFYAASRQLHVSERNSGISLAIGKLGKWAGLTSTNTVKTFYTNMPEALPDDHQLPHMSLYEALRHGAAYQPAVLANVQEDPRGKTTDELGSYAMVSLYAYDQTHSHGQGMLLAATLGSTKKGTATASDDYESVGIINGGNKHTKDMLLKYLKYRASLSPGKITSLRQDLNSVPIVMSAQVKNAVFYGIQFTDGKGAEGHIIDASTANNDRGRRYWQFAPPIPQSPCNTIDFSSVLHRANGFVPTKATKGSIAVRMTPLASTKQQTVMRFYGDDKNNIGIYYLPDGSFLYQMLLHGTEFAAMRISPPPGQSFIGKEVVLTVEALKNDERKYGKNGEDASVLRVKCEALKFEKVVQQDILWRWKHDVPTEGDQANARANSFAQFTAFVAGIDKITIGASDGKCSGRFLGDIHIVEVAEQLPKGVSDFH